MVVRQSTEAAAGDLDGLAFLASDLVVAVSQSGTSPETVAAARLAAAAGSAVVALTAHLDAPLGKRTDLVVPIASGEERGASTKSAVAELAALLAICGALQADAAGGTAVQRRLETVIDSWPQAIAPGRALGDARHVWMLGFGAALGLAGAGALLWHEKVVRPATAATPSEFRHGLVEAATENDALVLITLGAQADLAQAYLDRLRAEVEALPLSCVDLAVDAPDDDGGEAMAALAALIRVQQLARAAALGGGTYRDGFATLRNAVLPADDLFA
jgi:glucosamine--fructose-6-phosphate aminotransferase (isomerizing)